MIVLDENIADAQRELLRAWKIRARQVGLDVGLRSWGLSGRTETHHLWLSR